MTSPPGPDSHSADTATLILDAVLLDKHMGRSQVIFYKHDPLPEDLVEENFVDDACDELVRPMPVRRLRTQAPNPDIHHDLPTNLVLKVGECVGHGRSGVAFTVEPVGLSPDAPNANLPPLVAKIGRQHYSKWLLREAYFYEEMQSLQGVAVPWFYGLYHARIPVVPGQGFLPWLHGWGLRCYRGNIGLKKCLKSYEKHDGKDDDDKEELKHNEQNLIGYGKFKDLYSDLVRQFEDEVDSEQRSTVIAMLILEEVGKPYLPIGGDNWPLRKRIPKTMRKQAYKTYAKIYKLGISHGDIKRENLREAPVRANLQQGAGRDHDTNGKVSSDLECRIIDFELSRKINFTAKTLRESDGTFLDRLIDNLPDGLSIGEHDE